MAKRDILVNIKSLKFSLIMLVLVLFLASSQVESYAQDHEQLSEEERIVIRFSHVVGERDTKGFASRRFAFDGRKNGWIC